MLFLITYDLENVETLAFRWWAAILSNAKRYSKTIISAWQCHMKNLFRHFFADMAAVCERLERTSIDPGKI